MREFRQAVKNNYAEGTLQRLLGHPSAVARQGAVLALGLVGTMDSNAEVAAALRDDDALVRKFAHDALWEIWLRGGTVDHAWQLRQAIQLPDFAQALAGLDDLIAEAPNFAEAFNQRAILFFRRAEYARSVSDCQQALRLNPYHFGAAAGMGQCYLKLRKPRAALRAFAFAVPAGLVAGASGFAMGEALVGGRIFPPGACYVRMGARVAEEGGADVPATWARARLG